ncbi:P-loop containing nucleoside triphosphate hydrolase protein [Limtongia smithiae]|uniref:P-loop containing nucleoside triphosphate hydrolase protein n=1 Tax=Limtongia smithiae TaxID=1125753 RepID=UPI0034CE28E0
MADTSEKSWDSSSAKSFSTSSASDAAKPTENSPLLSSSSSSIGIDVPTHSDEFSGLPAADAKILREQVNVPPVNVGVLTVYRYATTVDKCLVILAFGLAIVEGCVKALMPLVFGAITETFTNYFRGMNNPMYYGSQAYNETSFYNESTHYNETSYYESTEKYSMYDDSFERISPEEFQRRVNFLALFFVYIGIADFLFSYSATFLFIDRGEVLCARIKENYLAAILRQNIGYFDKLGSGEITTRISSDTILIQEGMSEKLGYITENLSIMVAAFVIGFVFNYKLTFIMMSIAVVIGVTFYVASNRMSKYFTLSLNGASAGASVAEEVLSSIRNVHAFQMQDRLAEKYNAFLLISEHWALRAGAAIGVVTGVMWLGVYSDDALGFWQGSRFLARGEISVGSIITVLAAMVEGTFAITNITPHFRSVANGLAAANKIFTTIDRESAIDTYSTSGTILPEIKGDIELKHVRFIYPSRPTVTVLPDYSLKIPAGKTIALVGASGSGKSTIVGLLERFYSPLGGQVLIDGHDITDLNVKWLRQQIALVSQEPTLFGCSIFENIAHGLIGTKYEHASVIEKRVLVIKACTMANAMVFIDTLPEGLETNVGERGFLLSGGQKQRIAIARAIVGDPRILLLDEATSALDTKSEGVVQEALDRASKDRTTIVIAHRLSTIKDADNIVVMRRGEIVEQGTHDELIAKRGNYYDLVKAQTLEAAEEKSKEEREAELATDQVEMELDEKAVEMSDLTKQQTRLTRVRTTNSSIFDAAVEDEVREYSTWELIKFLAKLSEEEKALNITGMIASGIQGLGYPSLGLFFGRCVQAFNYIPDYERMLSEIRIFAGLFFMLAMVEFGASILALGIFAYAGQKLVRRVRMGTFKQIIRQDISFFDRDENSTGALTSTLASDGQAVDGLSGATFGRILNSGMIVVSSMVLSLIVAWQLALVCGACVPILIGAGYYRFHVLTKFQQEAKKSHLVSAAYACEATSAIKTVVSLTRESDVMQTYHETMDEQLRKSRVKSNASAFWYGVAQGMIYMIMALAFWFGSLYIKNGTYNIFQFYVTFMSVVYGAQSAGIIFSFAPDMGKAYEATAHMKALYDMEPVIDVWSSEGEVPENVQGNIDFKDVHFRYPTRMQVPVLRGLNLSIKKGQYVALVGSSGCGKSTTIGLLESFYRPQRGQVLLDGQDVSKLNVNAYRSHIAMVQQEPVLYAGSIRENVLLGSLEPVTEEQIVAACQKANIHDFIMSLPDGYDTLCGSKGALLSGGQKQRVAIARALIRDPKILLLDEATSALDNESEKVVQAALDAAAKGRTTIAVAHRLSSIQRADVIYVFDGGVVLESGTHQELLAKRGRYYELVKLQALEAGA